MAAGDTAHWLQNKLGETDDLWSGKTICSQLNADRLLSIQECFSTLFPHVKIKLLLSFLHLPRRNIEQWQEELNYIINNASLDSNPWVATVAEIMGQFPDNGSLNVNLVSSQTYSEILADLKKAVKKSADVCMLPLECQYLNKQALSHAAGQIAPLTRHFQIKRKPKSATLRADIVSKSTEAANNKKNNVPNSVPIKSRSFLKKMDTTTPMKGIPSRAPPSSAFRSTPSGSKIPGSPSVTVTPMGNTWVTNRPGVHRTKEGGVKFLEIGEQPVGAREAKKRKRQAELEAMEQAKKAKLEAEAAAAAAAASAVTTAQAVTPDYAAGLIAPATSKMPGNPMLNTTVTLSAAGPTYVPPSVRAQHPTPQTPTAATLGGVGALSIPQQARKNLQNSIGAAIAVTPAPTTATIIRTVIPSTVSVSPAPAATVAAAQAARGRAPSVTVAPTGPTIITTMGAPLGTQPTTIIVQASPQLLRTAAGQKLVATQVRLPAGVQVAGQPGAAGTVQVRLAAPAAATLAAQQQQQLKAQQQQQQQQQQQIQVQVQQPGQQQAPTVPVAGQQQKKGLSLTRDQMIEAQEMFRVSNKVSRPEKALILGFMAGSRDNPCPAQGNVLNIKLSEDEEVVAQPDGTQKKVLVDTYFQMNYGTGEWKRFRKFRDPLPS